MFQVQMVASILTLMMVLELVVLLQLHHALQVTLTMEMDNVFDQHLIAK